MNEQQTTAMAAFLADNYDALTAMVRQGWPGDEVEAVWRRVLRLAERQACELQDVVDAMAIATDESERQQLSERADVLIRVHQIERAEFR
jgi:hypothetical protein